MIARVWKGWTTKENSRKYEELFKSKVLPKVTRGVRGHKGTDLLRRESENEVEFTTIFWFESLEDVKSFAGEKFERAVVPGEVQELMLRYEKTVQHHEVVL
ncbi:MULTISPECIES: hypothetical protein [unclassified Microbulbifer]|uniref:hypothetical protein n=1 Tax=unclassified Microbulbifer TaxID=2619833 RepID=UPI0027E45258|nr:MULTISPECIES: hypothetical protein [unclassified Microbulbifer]